MQLPFQESTTLAQLLELLLQTDQFILCTSVFLRVRLGQALHLLGQGFFECFKLIGGSRQGQLRGINPNDSIRRCW